MKKLLRFALLILLAVVLSACATGAKFAEVNPALVSESPNMGRIFFYRPSSFGAALQPDVMLNNEKIGKAISWGFFYVDRPAGSYECVTSTEVERKVSFILEPGQTRYVRLSVSLGFFVGHVYGELVDGSVGLKEIKDCKYIGQEKL
jgi:hypothetical protein